MKPKGAQNGFSLLEAVIALAIASFALIAAYEAFSVGLIRLKESENMVSMLAIGERRLAEAKSIGLAPRSISGTTPAGRQWILEITPFTEEELPNGINSIQLNDGVAIYQLRFAVDRGLDRAPFVIETLATETGDGA